MGTDTSGKESRRGSVERLSLDDLGTLVHGVRSISGALAAIAEIEKRGVDYDHGEQKVLLINRLIEDLLSLSGYNTLSDIVRGTEGVEGAPLRGLTQLYLRRASLNTIAGVDLHAGERDARQALSLARRTGSKGLESRALSTLGNTLLAHHRMKDAAEIFRLEVTLERERGATSDLVRAIYNLARALIGTGEPGAAREVVREGLAIYDREEKMGEPTLPLFGKVFLLQIWQELHEDSSPPEVTLGIARQSVELLQRLKMHDQLITVRLGIVRILLIENRLEEAMREILEVERGLSDNTSSFLYAQFLSGLTAVSTALHSWAFAEEAGTRGLRLARSTGDRSSEAIILERLAEVARRQGDLQLARQRIDAALKVEGRDGKRAALFVRIAALHLERGEIEEAREAFEIGRELVEKSGAHKIDAGLIQLVHGTLLLAEGKEQGVEMVQTIEDLPSLDSDVLTDSHLTLSRYFEERGEFEKALFEQKKHHTLVVAFERVRRESEVLRLQMEQRSRLREREERKEGKRRDTIATNILRSGVVIESARDRLKVLNEIADPEEKREELEKVLSELQRAISNDQDHLLQHLATFEEGFVDRLTDQWPSLTPGQIRLASLIRAGLDSREIAALLTLKREALTMQRKRLRKRLELQRGESLERFLRAI